MILYLANGRYVPTQAEAHKASRDFRKVDVPTMGGREALCDWLNANRDPQPTLVELIDQGPVALTEDGFKALEDVEPMCEGQPFHLQTLDIIHVEEYINKADHRSLAAILNSATWRLGELRKALGVIA